MSDKKILHFTIGPVQGFVAQARRTRDLWGGSFLLSWLAGHAMKAVLDNDGGRIVFPIVHDDDADKTPTDPLLKAIMKHGGAPRIGTIPNRFKAEVPKDFDPNLCTKAVNDAWEKVCKTVWGSYVQGVATNSTKEIWNRQIGKFWEIAWVCDNAPDKKSPGYISEDTWLDLRKNWRDHRPPDEGGDHCMIMGDWQELSGFVRFRESKKQDDFWKNLRSQSDIDILDLREGERLCAIALVKRLFPKVAKEAIGWEISINNWPSTSYMAAIPWIREAWKIKQDLCKTFATKVTEVFSGSFQGERQTRINCLDEFASNSGFKSFSGLDGNVFRISALENERYFSLKDGNTEKERVDLVGILKSLKEKTGAPLSPYYAVLMMDGDRMGAQLREHAQEVSEGLARFTDSVDTIVVANNGVTIYAGGDDVLAMFPLDYAISAAHELRKAYQVSFKNAEWATISAAIVYAHHHHPLRSVLHQAHWQLEAVAKEQNGRDSLALCVLKGGDISSSWVGCWQHIDKDKDENFFPAQELAEIAEEFSRTPQFSSGFLYALRDRLHDLLDSNGGVGLGIDIIKQVLQAEHLRNRELSGDRIEAKATVDKLVRAIRCYPRIPPVTGKEALQADGPILLRFLAFKGVDE